MQLGKFTVEQLNEGQFETFADGTINRRPVDGEKDSTLRSVPKRSSSLIGINPVYITDGAHHMLLDAGLGWGLDAGSAYDDISNIKTNLEIFGIAPEQITHVILSHLHYKHSAGCSFTNAQQAVCPTFPNATYIVQQSEWDFAIQQVQHDAPHSRLYALDDLYRLYADSCFEMIDHKEWQLVPGITLLKTGGHTAGHQIVKITDEGETAYFLGDLLATKNQLNHYDVEAGHLNRMQTKKMKVQLLKSACRENAVLFFYHSLFSGTGRVEKDQDEQYVLKEL